MRCRLEVRLARLVDIPEVFEMSELSGVLEIMSKDVLGFLVKAF